MKPVEFCQKMLAEWQEKQRLASENGDYDAWQFAEREVANYQAMLAHWEQKNDAV